MKIINISIQFRMAMTKYDNVVQSHRRKVKGQERDSGRRQYDAWLKIKRLEATQFGRNGAAQPVLLRSRAASSDSSPSSTRSASSLSLLILLGSPFCWSRVVADCPLPIHRTADCAVAVQGLNALGLCCRDTEECEVPQHRDGQQYDGY